jgi:hypothetical protein
MDIPRKEKPMKYTDAQINEMKRIGSFNYDSAKAFADKNGLSFRSVIAKVRALELDYQPKDPKVRSTTSKPKGRAKVDIVTAIQTNLQMELPSLSKMTVADLEVLERELKDRVVA